MITATTDAEYSRVKTSVWWDIENCEVPKGLDAHGIAQNVSSALKMRDYDGPVSICAYGDTNLIPHDVQQALSSTAVTLNHVPAGVKDASDKKILVDMCLWAADNPAPANLMLISGDRDFSYALHKLSMRRYNIFLAQPPRASAPLVAAAKYVWHWKSLASGGAPITSGESSRLINNGPFLATNYQGLEHTASKQAQSNKPTDSTSEVGGTKEHRSRENHFPGILPQGGKGATCESNTAHLSDKRHISQAAILDSGKAQASVSAKPIVHLSATFLGSRKAQASVSAKPIQEPELVETVVSQVCQVNCAGKETYVKHTYGRRHGNNLELQSRKSENMSEGPVQLPKEVLEKMKMENKSSDCNTKPKTDQICRLCNVVCLNRIAFDSYLRGKKHAAMLSQSEALIDSRKIQEKGVKEKDKPKEKFAEHKLQCQKAQENVNCFEKHVVIVNQSEFLPDIIVLEQGLIDSKKLQEQGVGRKDQPKEKFAETPKNSKCFEKQKEELREKGGSPETIVLSTKDQGETVNKKHPNGEFLFGDLRYVFEVPKEQRGIDGIVKPVNLSKAEHAGDVKKKETAFVASDVTQSSVSTKHINQPEDLQPVWCHVCEISCNSKVAYANHITGKKHRQILELHLAKNESAKLSKENAEEKKKILCKNQTTFDSHLKGQKHPYLEVKEQAEVEVLEKIDDLGFKGVQANNEERNAISESSERAFSQRAIRGTHLSKEDSKRKRTRKRNKQKAIILLKTMEDLMIREQ